MRVSSFPPCEIPRAAVVGSFLSGLLSHSRRTPLYPSYSTGRGRVPAVAGKAENMAFNVGDSVVWVQAFSVSSDQGKIGTVIAVMPSDFGSESFHMYDVRFDMGLRTLYGSQLQLAPESD